VRARSPTTTPVVSGEAAIPPPSSVVRKTIPQRSFGEDHFTARNTANGVSYTWYGDIVRARKTLQIMPKTLIGYARCGDEF
jgi:hypothetical protein